MPGTVLSVLWASSHYIFTQFYKLWVTVIVIIIKDSETLKSLIGIYSEGAEGEF